MKRIAPELWLPADGMQLEPNALDIAKGSENNLVVAGPGAGKTELLAQKACYLLQTNTCPYPYKILAISFKRDAAFNLKQRVRQRCGEELSRRFDSLTFDSFAKQILDRFKQALPDTYKFSNQYKIIFDDESILDNYRNLNITYVNTNQKATILNFHTTQLPHKNNTQRELLRSAVWQNMLTASTPSLSFKMIMRLAELLINNNPKIKHYLQQTYKYVFLDEFQDTTGIQYEFFKSCFLGGENYFTAVGDDKQRIMSWAGAQDTVFEDFITNVAANRVPLTMNFRSAPRIVTLLNHLTEHLLGKSDFAIPSPKWQQDEGECSVWVFNNPQAETEMLFKEVSNWVLAGGLNPREVCILIKQNLSKYAGDLITYFNKNGIKARDENNFQDLLTQEICEFIINMLYTLYDKKNNSARQSTFEFLCNLHTEFEEYQLLKLDTNLAGFIKQIRKEYPASSISDENIKAVINKIIDFADKDLIKASFTNYKNIAELDSYILKVEEELIRSFNESKEIIAALDMLIGKDTIPVMTIHKSKGLEYHTVIFIGLEDGAFWSFQKQPDEDKCAFFVALSRAKEKVIFTLSDKRKGRYGEEKLSIKNITVILKELQNSGVVGFKKWE